MASSTTNSNICLVAKLSSRYDSQDSIRFTQSQREGFSVSSQAYGNGLNDWHKTIKIHLMPMRFILAILIAACALADFNFAAEDRGIVLVVPQDWETAAADWITHRQGQGYQVAIVHPAWTAYQTREQIIAAANQMQIARPFVVLASDARTIEHLWSPRGQFVDVSADWIPCFYQQSTAVINFGGEAQIATDYLYGDLDKDAAHVAECPVGRIPAQDSTQLQHMLARSIDYETQMVAGPWLHSMDLTAGIGGFSMLADLAITGFSRALLMEALPPEYQINLTQAGNSIYNPSARLFHDAVIEQIRAGNFLWVYVGHGHVTGLDYVYENRQAFPILESADAANLRCENSGSIAVFLSCLAGATDTSEDCLAEKLVRQPNGPVAAIASSRISMPYGLGVLAKAMLHQMFAAQNRTLGEVCCQAKLQIAALDIDDPLRVPSQLDQMIETMAGALSPAGHDLAAERREHLWLINLLGDPTLQLHRSETIEFQHELLPSDDAAVQKIRLHGNSPVVGKLRIECLVQRGVIPSGTTSKTFNGNDSKYKRYLAANRVTLSQTEITLSQSRFDTVIELPKLATGKYELRLSIYNQDRSAIANQTIQTR